MHKAVMNQQSERPSALISGWFELVTLMLVAAPLLLPDLFPTPLALVALAMVALTFFMRYWRTGEFVRYCHANWPVLALLFVFAPMSLIVSPLPMTVSWPRFTALIWSIALYFTVSNWPQDVTGSGRGRTRLTLPTKLYLVLGALIGVIGLLGMRSVDKLFYIPLPDLVLGWNLFGEGLATNEIAGALTLFVPFAAALALGGLSSRRYKTAFILSPLALFLLGVMVLSQSRTALFGTAIALILVVVLLLRPGWKWAAAGLVLAGVVAILAGQTGLLDRFVYAGANSWDSVVNPRLNVWQQGIFALRDFPLWGMGLGLFGMLAPRLYPLVPFAQAKILEDAHNLYLQSMLDFGVIGGLVFLSLLVYALVVLVRLVRRRRPRTMGRAWVVGLLAALVAHMLYSLTDAVAAGTLAGVPLWFLLGLTMARSRDAKPVVAMLPAAVAVTSLVMIIGGLAWVTFPTNQAARLTAAALVGGANQAEAAQAVSLAAETSCDLHWYEGLLYNAQPQPQARDTAWGSLLGCTDRFALFMPSLAPGNSSLAHEMIKRRPASPVGYFWLAEMVTADDPSAAIAWYEQGLKLAPEDGRRWGLLGDLLVDVEPDAALVAYLQACQNGDSGANGCLRAGSLAEKQGRIDDAISYYRLSKYSGAQERADELERAVSGQP